MLPVIRRNALHIASRLFCPGCLLVVPDFSAVPYFNFQKQDSIAVLKGKSFVKLFELGYAIMLSRKVLRCEPGRI